MNTAKTCWYSCLSLLGTAVFILTAHSASTVFTLDHSQSQIIISGDMAGFPITPQGTGSLTNSYSGSLNADLTGSAIQFTGGSSLGTQNNGVWQPAAGGVSGSAPADYGAEASVSYPPFGSITVYGALRNIVFDITSPVLPVTGGGFNGAGLVFSFASSSNAAFDYRDTISSGSLPGTGFATNTVATGSTLSVNGSTQTVVIPINASFYFTLLKANDTIIHLSGQLVATNMVAAPPEINSVVANEQNIILTVQNATTLSQLLVSTNLTTWQPAKATTATNSSGAVIFTTPISGPREFFQVEQ